MIKYDSYYEYKDKKLIGLLVYRVASQNEAHVGVIAELYEIENNADNVFAMLSFATKNLLEKNVLGIYCASSDNYIKESIEKIGFLEERNLSVMLNGNSKILNCENVIKSLISMGDHDWDQPYRRKQLSIKKFIKCLCKFSKSSVKNEKK